MQEIPNRNKIIISWLFAGCFLVAAMVIIGGITRLTHSGLSMVNWRPIMGTLPPLNVQQWQETFELYKQSPEYQKVNAHFNLEEFKSIFWWEYIHRLLGRLIGLVFLLPFAFFLIKGWVKGPLLKKLVFIFLLGGLQGLLGWFMVKSGLVDRPSVSHYRLAAHLVTALFLYVYIFWVALDLIFPLKEKQEKFLSQLRKNTGGLLALLTIQIVYGAFVAGLKAGFIMNTYPLMAGYVIHPSISNAFSEMGLSALTEHIVTVQFIHRTVGLILLVFGIYVWWIFRNRVDSKKLKLSLNLIVYSFLFQFLLGVLTLIYVVPVWLGVLHQFGAIVLLTVLIFQLHETRKVLN